MFGLLGRWIQLTLLLTAGVVGAYTAPAQAQISSEEEARDLFDQGASAYEAGRYDEAASLFRRAYLLSDRVVLLYNIGQSELRAGRDAAALEAFESYLRRSEPGAVHRAQVTERVRVLRGMTRDGQESDATEEVTQTPSEPVTEPQSAPTTPAVREPARSSSGGELSPAGLALLIAGLGVAVAGGGLLLGAAMEANAVNSAEDGSRWSVLQDRVATAEGLWASGWLALGIGSAGAVVGAILLATDGHDDPLSLRIGPTSVALEGSFE